MFKLICFDMDGVIFEHRNFWMELHKIFGTYEKGKELTKKYLYTDYDRLVEEVVVKLWKGKDAKLYYELVKSIKYLSGVKEVFKELHRRNFLITIISGSSIDLARRAQHDLGIDYIFATELVIKDGKVYGEYIWPIGAEGDKKVEIVKNLCKDLRIKPEEVIYIGDSEIDIPMFKYVGRSIAFNSDCEELKKVATFVVEGNDLRKILEFIE